MIKKWRKLFKRFFLQLTPVLLIPVFVGVACEPFGAIKDLNSLKIGQKNPWDQQLDLEKPLDSLVSGRIRNASLAIKASDFLKKVLIASSQNGFSQSGFIKVINRQENILNNTIIWSYIPGVDNFDLNDKFQLEVNIIPNSANDFYGSIKVKVDAYEKDSQQLIQSKIFVITGFQTNQTGIWAYKERITKAFANINELNLKDQENFDTNKISTQDFWDFVNLPENFEKMDYQKQRNYDQLDVPEKDSLFPSPANIAKNPWRLTEKPFYYIKGTILGNSYDKNNNKIDVILSIYHDSFQKSFVSKIVQMKIKPNNDTNLKKLIENPNFQLKQNYQNFLPSFLTNVNYNNEFFNKFIDFGGIDYKNFDIKVVPSLSNDENGDFYLILNGKNQNMLAGAYSPGQIIKVQGFNSYKKIFEKQEFRKQINFDYLDSWYKLSPDNTLAEKLKNISDSLNASSDSLLWPLFGQAIQSSLADETLFKNTSELHSFDKLNYQFSSLVDFKVDEKAISFWFSNWVQDFYKISIPFTSEAKTKNIVADFGKKVYETDIINTNLRARSLVIQLRSNAFDKKTQTDTTRITSGTAWVFDRKLKKDDRNPGKFLPTNTYYLATNLHVIADLINNPEQIYSFSYLLDGNLKNLDTISFDNSNLFRRFDRVSKTKSGKDFLPPEGFQYITSEADQFWKNLKINPIGLNSPEPGKFRDIAIIEITFPNDQEIKNPFKLGIPFLDFDDIFSPQATNVKNIPDAIRFYNENPLNFLITNKLEPVFSKFANQNNVNDKETILPLHAYLGGFLGGYSWKTDDKNSFVTTERIAKENEFRQNKKITKFDGADAISLPGLRGGHGMSGSLVVNEYNQVLGIFWGGYFPSTSQGLVKGIGQFDPIGIKTDASPTILAKWLAQTQDIQTDLDSVSTKVFEQEKQTDIEKLANSTNWIGINSNLETQSNNI